MNMEIVKQIPDILEHPVIVLKSKLILQATRAKAAGWQFSGKCTTRATRPRRCWPSGAAARDKSRGYPGPESCIQRLWQNKSSRRLHRQERRGLSGEDRKRTDTWLHGLGLQLPSYTTTYGPIGRISYHGSFVKIEGVPYQDLVRRESNEPMLPGGKRRNDSDGNELTPTQNPDIRYSAAGTGKEQRRGETYAEKLRKDSA